MCSSPRVIVPVVQPTIRDVCSWTIGCKADIREDDRSLLDMVVGIPCLVGHVRLVTGGVEQ
jgi:hypothetical protein